ncbi:MAG TPA: indolepyruvate oxidoreductase subunit beta family protein [Steroidobacteraceae bacterium]
MKRSRPITLSIAALGGQGGGVVTDWLVMAARRAGYFVQATSVPGVAQRTGATIYYLEFFPRSDAPEGREPIMALMPNPGDVDIVVASEWMEAGRAINRGLVTKDRTTLIASTHRDYTIGEKIALGEGRASSRELFEIAAAQSAKLIGFDMIKVAEAAGGRISAVILGSIAGAGVLPWGIEEYHHAIKESGVGVEASLAAFEAGRVAVIAAAAKPLTAAAWPAHGGESDSPDTLASVSAALRARIESRFPAALHELLGMAAARLSDYLDEAYAGLFLDRIELVAAQGTSQAQGALTAATARSLALWMSFEDVLRVAQLKTRRGRAMRIRREVQAQPADLVEVREFVKPRVTEICDTLPAGLGRRLLASARAQRTLARLTAGRRISTTSISGFALLRGIAACRRFRRASLRYQIENQRIEAWLKQIAEIAPQNCELAVELAECQTLVKGYGDTHERGWASFSQLSSLAPSLVSEADGAARLRALREAALADDSGSQLDRVIASLRIHPPVAA